jgi:hypothetical protein
VPYLISLHETGSFVSFPLFLLLLIHIPLLWVDGSKVSELFIPV